MAMIKDVLRELKEDFIQFLLFLKVMTMKREIKAYYGNEVPQEKVCVFLEKWFCNLILEYLRDFTKSFWERFFELSKSVGECDAVVSLVLELKQIGTSLEMAEESLLKDVDCNIHIVDNCYMVMAICSTLLCSIPPVFCNSMLLLCCKAFAAYDLKHSIVCYACTLCLQIMFLRDGG